MKTITTIVGLCLIILGIVVFGYQGFTYTKHETVAEIGNIQVTADKKHTILFPPLVGGASLVAGIILVVIGRINGK